eukprot:c22097_g1_i1.p1 GENE.c22097_g1_i1~~c22097_g1_i1.p1  ORF type:complete len:254 (+),score=106.45 c22097_g1_i1:26-787(+)
MSTLAPPSTPRRTRASPVSATSREKNMQTDEDIRRNEFEAILPRPAYYGVVKRAGSQEVVSHPNLLIVNSTLTNEKLIEVFQKFWNLPYPNFIATIFSASSEENLSDETLSKVSALLTRVVVKRGNIWILLDGKVSSKINQCIGSIVSGPGFVARNDIIVIGIQGVSDVSDLSAINRDFATESVVVDLRSPDVKSVVNINLTHHLILYTKQQKSNLKRAIKITSTVGDWTISTNAGKSISKNSFIDTDVVTIS